MDHTVLKMELFMTTAVGTSNHAQYVLFLSISHKACALSHVIVVAMNKFMISYWVELLSRGKPKN
jgi:hypothetical protein